MLAELDTKRTELDHEFEELTLAELALTFSDDGFEVPCFDKTMLSAEFVFLPPRLVDQFGFQETEMFHLFVEQLEKRFGTEALQQVPEALGKAFMIFHKLHDGILIR